MSFLKKLFGGGAGNDNSGKAKAGAAVEHEGYLITPTPQKEGGQYRLAGTISMEIDDETKAHQFIRADLFTSADECNDACIRKAKQVIKEQGTAIFK